jgi:hypothetical protein
MSRRLVVSVPADGPYGYDGEAENEVEALDLVEASEAGEYALQTEGFAQPRSEWNCSEAETE